MTQTKIKTVEDYLNEAYTALAEAEKLADETGTGFSWSGPTYGMGGYYSPKPKPVIYTKETALELLKSGKTLTAQEREAIASILNGNESHVDDWYSSTDYGWSASSQSC